MQVNKDSNLKITCAPSLILWLRHGHWIATWNGVSELLYHMSLQDHGVWLGWFHAKPVATSWSWIKACYQLIHICQLKAYEQMAHFRDVDFVYCLFSVWDNPEWGRRMGHSLNSWMGQVARSCQAWLGMGRVTAWWLPQKYHLSWWQWVNEGKCLLVYASHWLVRLSSSFSHFFWIIFLFSNEACQ